MKSKDFMLQIKKLDKMIENKLAEREHWLSIATSTTAAAAPETGVRVQTSGSKQQMENAVARYIDIERDINDCIDHLYDERKKIISVIEKLDVVQYDLLHKMYVGVRGNGKTEYMNLNQVAELYEKSYSWATTMHGIALKHVQEIIDREL